MNNREAIGILQAHVIYACEKAGLSKAALMSVEDALDLAISALEKQEQSCDTCKHKSEQFSGKRCGDCSIGYPDRYEAETNFEATSKNFEPYTEEES